MNVNKVLKKDYEKKLNGDLLQNEPNSNPILSRRSLWRSRIKPNFTTRIPQIKTDKAYLVQEANSDVYKRQRQPNFLGVKPLHTLKKRLLSQSVDFLQQRPLIHIKVVFRKEETKLTIYTLVSSVELILDVRNNAEKKHILGRLGTTFALI
ncbi:MAG: hypothetical protein ACYS32_10770 [Planctomycetota bacterium]|jgi:hypothetical protein